MKLLNFLNLYKKKKQIQNDQIWRYMVFIRQQPYMSTYEYIVLNKQNKQK